MTLASVERYDADRIDRLGDRAVVLGGSVAGLCAARVLADAFGEVVVIERDALPDEPAARDGAPQTSHPHAMLEAGRATLEDLFPGFGEGLLAAGGLLVDAGREMEFYDQGGYLADPPSRLPMYCASRPLFEWVVRRRATGLPNVSLRDGRRFTGYRLDGDAVTGVDYRDGDGTERSLDADLVVDATGRTSRTPGWLDRNGYGSPPVEEVTVDLTYSTVHIERPETDRRVLFNLPRSPRTRGGALIPVEGDRWQAILSGVHGDDAPTDPEGVRSFADSLPVADIGDLLRSRAWTSEVHHYPFPSSRRRRYGAMERFPEGLVVTGDAVASFNPVYGQGMSVAALDALQLHHALAAGGLDGIGPRFFDRVSDVVDVVWQLAVGADFGFPGTTGPKPFGTDLFNWYTSRLVRRAHADGELSEAFARVLRLEEPPTSLLRPGVARRVLLPTLSG